MMMMTIMLIIIQNLSFVFSFFPKTSLRKYMSKLFKFNFLIIFMIQFTLRYNCDEDDDDDDDNVDDCTTHKVRIFFFKNILHISPLPKFPTQNSYFYFIFQSKKTVCQKMFYLALNEKWIVRPRSKIVWKSWKFNPREI